MQNQRGVLSAQWALKKWLAPKHRLNIYTHERPVAGLELPPSNENHTPPGSTSSWRGGEEVS
jgi:hypothetical protein